MDNNNEDDKNDQESVYEVGYKKPPKSTRFQPGQSGNRKGRPKGAKGLSKVYMEEANQRVPIRIGDRTAKVTKIEAIIKRLLQKALEGNIPALGKVIEIARMVEPQQMQQQIEQTISADEQKIIKEYMKRRQNNGDSDAD